MQLALDDCQRWRAGRDSYRPAGEPIDPRCYGVEVVREADAKAFVVANHYSGSFPAARLCVGLFRAQAFRPAEMVGVAVFSVPMQGAAIPAHTGVGSGEGVELGRFVLLDDVPGNGETWMLARAFKALRREKPGVRAVLAYSDPVPRERADGTLVKPGHVGTIYQAFNARYCGRGRSEKLILDARGRVVSRRAMSKLRNGESGQNYAYRQLLDAGAPERMPHEDADHYLRRALGCGAFREMRHPGNHVYTWRLDGARASLGLPYPKQAQPWA